MRWGLTVCVGVATSLSSKTFDEHLASLRTAWVDPSQAAAAYLKHSASQEGKPSMMVPVDCWSSGPALAPAPEPAGRSKAAVKKHQAAVKPLAPQYVQDLLVYNDDFCLPCGPTARACHSGVPIESVYWPPVLQMRLVRADAPVVKDETGMPTSVFKTGNPPEYAKSGKMKNAQPLSGKLNLCPVPGTPCSLSSVRGVLRVGPRGSEASASPMFLATDPDEDGSTNELRWVHYIEKCVTGPKQVNNFQVRDRCEQGDEVWQHNKDVLEWATALMFSPNSLTNACKTGADRCAGSLLYAHMWLSKSKNSVQVNFRMERDLGYTKQDGHPQWQCHRQQVSWPFLDGPAKKGLSAWLSGLDKTTDIVKACSYNYLWKNLRQGRDSLQLGIMGKLGLRQDSDSDDED